MNDVKDRFGEKIRLVRRARENIYFAEKDRQLIKRLRTRLGTAHRPEGEDIKRTARQTDRRRGKHGAPSKVDSVSRAAARFDRMNARQSGETIYLVPVGFSTGSKIALRYAAKIARRNQARLLLLHVINWKAVLAREFPRKHIETLKNKTSDGLEKLATAVRLEPGEYQSIVLWGSNTARAISDYAKEIEASMIIMGSHGRTGLKRLMLVSVAERTLRYAKCPVVIVKK